MNLADTLSVSIAALALALSGVFGIWSVRTARRANALAREAVDAAREANDLVAQSDRRGQERHDVRWEAEWADDVSEWRLINTGIDTAHAVTLVANAGYGDQVADVPAVATGEHIAIPTFGEPIRKKEADESYNRWVNSPPSNDGIVILRMPYRPGRVAYRVYWQTALGTAHSEESEK